MTVHNRGFYSPASPTVGSAGRRRGREKGLLPEEGDAGERTGHGEDDDRGAATRLAPVPLRSGFPSNHGEASSPARVN